VEGRLNVRPQVGLEGGAGDSRLGVQVGHLGGMGVGRSMAGSLLWRRRDPGTVADAATAGLSVKSSSKHTNWTWVIIYFGYHNLKKHIG